MCGKFTQMATWRQVHEYSNLLAAKVNDEVKTFTPMQSVPVVHLDQNGDRIITPMTWGFTDRRADGRRIPKQMHARGETVHQLPVWSDAFHHRRGVTFAQTFNEGKDFALADPNGVPTGKTWTQQWTIRQLEGKPTIIGVIFDVFDVGRGPEYEFAQVTVPANDMISAITTRMPLLLEDDDVPLWLGEWRASTDEVLDLIRSYSTGADWEMSVEDPSKKPPQPRAKRPKPEQRDLF